jgi:nitrate reductase gamma subunit
MQGSRKSEIVLVGGMLVVGVVIMLIARVMSGPVTSITTTTTLTDWYILALAGLVAVLCLGYSLWCVVSWAKNHSRKEV